MAETQIVLVSNNQISSFPNYEVSGYRVIKIFAN